VKGPFDLLVCDCDGVIIDSEVIVGRVLNSSLRRAFPDHDADGLLAGCHGQQNSALLERLSKHIGEPIEPSFVQWLDRQVDEAIRREARVVAGVREALEQIPLPVAVVSNSSREWVEVALARAGLTSRVGNAIFSADRAPVPKPAPDVFLMATRELGVAPARCLVVEDSVSGVTAARAAGMAVLGFVGASHIAAGHVDRLLTLGVIDIVERMEELPRAVAAARSNGQPA
jgi:HAD superfamily hydrolase (TIGR01509 family)